VSRNRERWDNDDDDFVEQPRRKSSGASPVLIVLLVLGSILLVGALGCGGLIILGVRKAERLQQEEEAVEARQRFEQIDHAMRPKGDPNHPVDPIGPGSLPPEPAPKADRKESRDPPPQPKATKFATDDSIPHNHWRVLFRSRRPELWNTNTQRGDDFAIPLQNVMKGTKYLRLRRMDSGEAIIIPMSRERVWRVDQPGSRVRWNGEGKDEHGGYHLGIAEGPVARFTEGRGTIGVLMDGWDANPGSGFGHAHHIENGGQRYSWLGKEIPATAFEIAVTMDELLEKEKAWLRK
jgi:hypothetical protein